MAEKVRFSSLPERDVSKMAGGTGRNRYDGRIDTAHAIHKHHPP